jgi:LmbE family N-acetylglucosaminyl deacetylase
VATLVTFHAHPDDEAISCGGTMAQAAAEGHRVVLVTATGGEHGEVAEGFLRPGEKLGDRRARELADAARILGVARLESLGYVDSGMMGTPENDAPNSFWTTDVESAAARVAEMLLEERADVFTVYDADGTYGHPDHIQVHRVGVRAAQLAGVSRVYESVANRDEIRRGFAAMREAEVDFLLPELEDSDLGVPEDTITTAIDVRDFLQIKRSAMAAHASQIAETSFFLAMPPDMFADAFGTEWYIRRGRTPSGELEKSLFDDLD